MAPILIDSRDILKLVSISVLVTVLVFAGGFFMGHERAATFYQAGSEVRPLSLPERVMAVENTADSQAPEVIEAGEDIDVDQPETTMLANAILKDSTSGSAVENSSETKNVSVPLKTEQAKDDLIVETTADVSVVNTFTSDELRKIKYSIQAGMYGRLVNAENMMKMLQAKHYDAYVSDYTNKKNEIRYNVRFGYFADKKSAISTLREFKAKQEGDGYLVKFSADNIVNIAGATDIEHAVGVPAGENKVDEALTPVAVPSDIAEDKISRADVLSNTLVTIN